MEEICGNCLGIDSDSCVYCSDSILTGPSPSRSPLTLESLNMLLQDRVTMLDTLCEVSLPGTPAHDEMAARYYECKTILDVIARG